MLRYAWLAGLLAVSAPALAEETPPADPPENPTVWIAGLQGGVVDRQGGPDSPYATASLTRYRGNAYLRGAFTVYRSTLRLPFAALPSTYYVGSLGAGGNFDDWVVDASVSYGRQDYGLVETDFGKQRSTISGTGYFAAGLRGGRVFRPAPHWYVTPTLSAQYVDTQSLRHGFAGDFEIPERAWTGSGAVRLDRTFGASEQNFVGVSLSHSVSDNGLTQLSFTLPRVRKTPDNWQEAALNGTVQIDQRLWLDGQVQRSFGAVAGDSTTVSLTLRLRL